MIGDPAPREQASMEESRQAEKQRIALVHVLVTIVKRVRKQIEGEYSKNKYHYQAQQSAKK